MIAVTGASSAIWREFVPPPGEKVVAIVRGERPPLQADRYLFAQGVIYGKAAWDMTLAEHMDTMVVNYRSIAESVELILEENERARICVIGSESGFLGSFDKAYADSKNLLHRFVETTRLRSPAQQLVAISPGVIGDAGMTTRRTDTDRLASRELAHPKRRFVTAREVARLAYFLLYQDEGYISGTVVRMHGGEAQWR